MTPITSAVAHDAEPADESATPHRARRPRRDAVENRAGILAAATEAIAHDPHASLDAIARRAGLSRRALYGHFEDREALIRAIVAAGAPRFNAIALAVDEDDDARVSLARLTSLLWREAALVQVAAAIALDEIHVAATAEALAPLRLRVLEIARRGQDDRVLRTDVSTETLARLIEEAARTVVTRMGGATPDQHSLAVRAVLSIAGLSWREAVELLAEHPSFVEER